MSELIILFSIIAGGAILYGAGDILVENSRRLGIRFKIDPMVIGLTVVAFGTSAPELFVSVQSALTGQSEIALGNVVGSNITNILLILGITAIIKPIKITKRTIRKDIPIMVGVSLVFLFFSLDLVIGRIDGLIMFVGLFLYIWNEIKNSKLIEEDQSVDQITEFIEDSLPKNEGFYIIGSLVGLMLGSKLLIFGATEIATSLGISELVIGLTIVAVGTSLPEIITSIIAAKRGESSIAIGNVVGSNIFNILGVMGLSTLLTPVPIPFAALSFDIPIMIFSSVACLPIVLSEKRISRYEGFVLFSLYVLYVSYLILIAQEHASTPVLSEITLVFILFLSTSSYFDYKKRNKGLNN